ncbi:MAG: hypothetical protein ABI343_01350 [Burkholderiaceae bacterium]
MKTWQIAGVLLASSGAFAAPPVRSPVKPDTVPAAPSVLVVSCDPGGCWDENGLRYDRAGGGVFIRRDGASCESIRGRMACK